MSRQQGRRIVTLYPGLVLRRLPGCPFSSSSSSSPAAAASSRHGQQSVSHLRQRIPIGGGGVNGGGLYFAARALCGTSTRWRNHHPHRGGDIQQRQQGREQQQQYYCPHLPLGQVRRQKRTPLIGGGDVSGVGGSSGARTFHSSAIAFLSEGGDDDDDAADTSKMSAKEKKKALKAKAKAKAAAAAAAKEKEEGEGGKEEAASESPGGEDKKEGEGKKEAAPATEQPPSDSTKEDAGGAGTEGGGGGEPKRYSTPELTRDAARHREGLNDPDVPSHQNPLHHYDDDGKISKIFREDFDSEEEFEAAVLPAPPLQTEGPDKLVASEHLRELAEEIVHLSILEMNELVNKIADHYGFHEGMLEPDDDDDGGGEGGDDDDGEGGDDGAAAAEEKTAFDVKLTGFDAKSKIKVIKEVRSIAGLGLKEAKEMVEGAPKVISKDIKKEQAEEIKTKLEAVGATVEIV